MIYSPPIIDDGDENVELAKREKKKKDAEAKRTRSLAAASSNLMADYAHSYAADRSCIKLRAFSS